MYDDVTILLNRSAEGDGLALDSLFPIVYDELRSIAAKYLRQERRNHTIQATALVHEAYIRLIKWETVSWQNRAHFFSVAAQIMRNILVDYARHKKAEIRGGNLERVTLDERVAFAQISEIDLVDLDDALNELAKLSERQSKIVELRFFGGLTIEEAAETLKVSEMTVKRDWNFSKAWLYEKLNV
jgi:RNA polymerase sigma factor (TIGR02999 family)